VTRRATPWRRAMENFMVLFEREEWWQWKIIGGRLMVGWEMLEINVNHIYLQFALSRRLYIPVGNTSQCHRDMEFRFVGSFCSMNRVKPLYTPITLGYCETSLSLSRKWGVGITGRDDLPNKHTF
jgi:hypothetical protein